MTNILSKPVEMNRAQRYSNPANPGALLPWVYGDLTLGGTGGVVPAVCIDTVNFAYLIADHPVSSIDNVYANNVEVTLGFTSDTSNDYEGQGAIAVIVFDADPQAEVSVRCKGKLSGANLIENPIGILEDFLVGTGALTSSNFEPGSLAESKARCESMSYNQFSWVFGEEKKAGDWFAEVLFNVLGFFHANLDDQIEIFIPTGAIPPESAIIDHVVASRDCVDSDDGVTMHFDINNYCNNPLCYCLYKWTTQGFSSVITSHKNQKSINTYGFLQKPFSLNITANLKFPHYG